MSSERTNLAKALKRIAHGPFRSSLFHWLYSQHDEITTTLNGSRIEWSVICSCALVDGVTDATGKPATEETTRKTWYRVRQEVRRQQQLKASRDAVQRPDRVRAPLSWQPPVVAVAANKHLQAQPEIASAFGSSGATSTTEKPVSRLTKSKTPEQLIAEVALKKSARDRTPEEKLAVLIAGQQDRSYSG